MLHLGNGNEKKSQNPLQLKWTWVGAKYVCYTLINKTCGSSLAIEKGDCMKDRGALYCNEEKN